MAEAPLTNGCSSPLTPRLNSFSLTEYSANPSPPSERHGLPPDWEIPEAFLLPNGYPDYLRLILTSRVYDVVKETPLTHAVNMSNRLECKVFLKREDLLPVFSFKLRGAYNKMAHLSPERMWKGVIACSAGNHAQGVAYSARTLKIPATIVMPQGTPAIKHRNVARLGGTVVLHGRDFDAAKQEAARLSKLHDLTNIPPFDDPYVIAGQGTCGMELLRQCNIQNIEAVFCCVGGGGLIAGIGVYLKRIAPHVKIIGVETHDANAMAQSLVNGERVTLGEVGLFADGAAVRAVGKETFRLCREVVDDIIQVSTDEACAAIKDIFEDTRSVVEPAGALALAGLKKYVAMNPSPDPNRELVAVTSGANMNFDRLRFVAERATLGERKEALLSVTIPERPGSFAKLVETVTPHDVTEFSYRYSNSESAVVFMGISLSTSTGTEDLGLIVNQLLQGGMIAQDLSDNELAKTHIRYLAGGRSNVVDERLFMFEFPERPGALVKFLTTLRPHQNISLFHYRNYGSDVAKVLAGIQCPATEKTELEGFLYDLGYPFTECTDSPVYKMFLRE
ncbi:threonine deaminase [Blastomyces dermatitidis]|uniref:Threonine dehydratase n=3 Tax=Blastomyces TaxID=229219 RepID=A0A179UE51_BLAGS|nr:threonine ammonia-lyase, biosynthetic [Blastomyces gilchristii SLH14081]XP_045275248.1 threonine ammonia-lyase, biosynthetic [Blastomyces dermatitidis ER-3]EEQ88025.1 threonine ammonia-lyase, biosynthetic [Blastomyces dermatitidis ER-3]EGE79572.1 threonine ammonia-lyase, biosynthetic [Blastomyces dermatitidis ATCC 18188]OAT06130.1 threonine ammonia-lyase, biosynthetic [Blastomyces gilchristii SLH14081]